MRMPDPDSPTVRRNFVLNVCEGGAYLSSTAFISVQTVLPALVARLGGSNIEVGSVSVIAFAGSFFPQILAARYAEAMPWKKRIVLRYGVTQRLMMILIGVAMLVLGGSRPGLALGAFLVLYALNQILAGLATPFWIDFLAKVTPTRRRGRLMGLRVSFGGAGAFAGGFVLTWLLTELSFPESYALAFLIAGALQMTSVIIQSKIVEEAPSPTIPRPPLAEYVRSLGAVVKENRNFSRFVGAMGLIILGSMPVGFYAVYALRRFEAPESMVGEFTVAMVLVQIVSAVINGVVADRRGNKAALIISGAAMVMASLTALLATTAGAFRLVFLFVGVNVGTEIMARYNMALEFSPESQRPTFIGLMNALLAPCYLVGILGGVLIDQLGYEAVFLAGLLCSLAGVLVLAFMVSDPRQVLRVPAVHGGAE